MSPPFLPIIIPGRALWMEIFAFLAGLSITTFETAAFFNLLLYNFLHQDPL